MLRCLFIAVFLSTFLSGSRGAQTSVTDFNKFLKPGEYYGTLRLDDRERQFIIDTPRGATTDKPRPIVFFFDDRDSSAEEASTAYGWMEKATAERFFVVFPQGLSAQSNTTPSSQLGPNALRDEGIGADDDLRYFSTLLDKLETVLPIDPRRVFVTGFANGGAETFSLGAHLSDRIAAIAAVSSPSFVTVKQLARPVPVYYLVGTSDPLVPLNGRTGTAGQTPPSALQSVEQWRQLDGCPAAPKTVKDKNGIHTVRYGSDHGDSEVLFTIVEGNGHHWPGSVESSLPAVSCPALDPFSATDRIWDFFKRHALSKAPPP